MAPFERRVREGVAKGLVQLRFRHRVTGLGRTAGAIDTVTGELLEPSGAQRGTASSREATGAFELKAQAVIVTSGGIGGNHDLVRKQWPERLGTPPAKMLSGVPAHVDGLMLGITEEAGAHHINRDRMWHYTEGIENWNPIWAKHGIRILPGPSSLWLDARGKRLPVPLFPGFDTLGTLEHITKSGYDYTWFVLDQKIIGKEFALSGSEQNPDLTGKSIRGVIGRARADVPGPVKAFMDNGVDFVVEKDLESLVRGMNALTDEPLIDAAELRREITARDRETANPFTKDLQITAIRGARTYLGDKLIRTAAPHRILDPAAGPLIAVRLNILTRKSLGGLETDLSSRVLREDGTPLSGVYAAGRRQASAAAGCTATARSKERSSVAASSPGGRRAGPRRRRSADAEPFGGPSGGVSAGHVVTGRGAAPRY